MNFQPGDIVECIDNSAPSNHLTLGAIYTVTVFLPSGTQHPACPEFYTACDGVDLAEAPRPPRRKLYGRPTGYYRASRFRKVYRPDPDLIANLLRNEAPADLVSA